MINIISCCEEWHIYLSHIFFSVKELATLHDRHLNRPTLDDSIQEEHTIEIMTQEITQVDFIKLKIDNKSWDLLDILHCVMIITLIDEE